MEIIFYTLVGIMSFFLWSFIHELSHGMMIKKFVKDVTLKFKIYPHFEEERFVWASISWKYPNEICLSRAQLGWISFAPRIPDYIGCLLTIALSILLKSPYKLACLMLVGGSILDLIWGSIGLNEKSDLQRYCKFWNFNPQAARILGFIMALFTVIISYYFL